MNQLFYGDNLDVLRRHVPDETADLIYLDPPFKSDQDYNVLLAERDGTDAAAQIKAFEDTWHWNQAADAAYQEVVERGGDVAQAMIAFRTFLSGTDMMAYLAMMAPRLIELKRVLKPKGSIYLHCDPTASHYLKMLMDAIFEPTAFRNEIVWKRTNARSTPHRWPRIHDILLFYTRDEDFVFHSLKVPADKAKLPHTLITAADGKKYQTYELTAPGATQEGESGKPWRGFDPNVYGRHWGNTQAVMNEWDKEGLIHWAKDGFPRRRAAEPFNPEDRMVTVGDVWTDIDRINQAAKERLGYPTQKPEDLMDRIIQASSQEGDTVLDPFCGCGTTIASAQRLNRRWIGIDITSLAITLIKKRLADAHGEAVRATYQTLGEPTSLQDAEALAAEDKYQFQWWALGLVNARPITEKKGADQGIDGRIYFHDEDAGGPTKQIILSVKGGHVDVKDVRELHSVVKREKAAIGVLITLEDPTKPMRKEAANGEFYASQWGAFPQLQILTVKDLLEGKTIKRPPTSKADVTFKQAPKAKYRVEKSAGLKFSDPEPRDDEEQPF